MTENTHYKTLLNAWLNLKQAMITASTHVETVVLMSRVGVEYA